jgi:hypothetical protein
MATAIAATAAAAAAATAAAASFVFPVVVVLWVTLSTGQPSRSALAAPLRATTGEHVNSNCSASTHAYSCCSYACQTHSSSFMLHAQACQRVSQCTCSSTSYLKPDRCQLQHFRKGSRFLPESVL